MLTTLEVYGQHSSTPELALSGDRIERDPIQILDIDGLGPVKADINTTPYSSFDAEAISGMFVGKRNIVLKVGLNPNWNTQTPAELRNLLYRYFTPKMEVELVFTRTLLPDVKISGVVEDCVPAIFSKDLEYQISIICPSPDFIAVEATELSGSGGTAPTPTVIDYEGTVPAGIDLYITRSSSGTFTENPFEIKLGSIDNPRRFGFNAMMTNVMSVRLRTIPGNKFIHNIRYPTGFITSLMKGVSPYAEEWPILFPGENNFSLITSLSNVSWELSYFARFGAL